MERNRENTMYNVQKMYQMLSDMDIKSDYHIHSNFSGDGMYSVKEIFHKAEEYDLRGISITDHDCIEGTCQARSLIESGSYNFDVISGIELTTYLNDKFIHILGYGFDPYAKTDLTEMLDCINEKRIMNVDNTIRKIIAAGVKINIDDFKKDIEKHVPMISTYGKYILQNPENFDNPILKPYLRNGSKSTNASINFAMDFMTSGRPLYVEEYKVSVEEGVQAISESGGIAVVAHPGLWLEEKHLSMLKKLIKNGLVGIEVFTPYHTDEQCKFYSKIADEYGLLKTHGSDYHGSRVKPHNKLGVFEQTD